MEVVAVKVTVTKEMIGSEAWLLTEPEKNSVKEVGEPVLVVFKTGVDQRSLSQMGLYWACVDLLVENKQAEDINDFEWSDKKKAHAQIRWALKYINKETAVHFVTPSGISKLYFELDSISFDKSDQKKVNDYFAVAFPWIAEQLKITEEELVREAKSRMKSGIRYCTEKKLED